MDAQDIRSLQEAYLDVYEAETGRGPRLIDAYDKPPYSDDVKDAPKYKPIKKGPKRKGKGIIRREETDLYDIILSHLLDEGYAETEEAAEAIMVNMGEEWRDNIVEEVLAKKGGVEGVGTGSNWKAKTWTDADKQRFSKYSSKSSKQPTPKSPQQNKKNEAPTPSSGSKTDKEPSRVVGSTKYDVARDRFDYQKKLWDSEFKPKSMPKDPPKKPTTKVTKSSKDAWSSV
jgi:hypothetical protein